jgi:3-deoxy-7-phosphoheptulonate synthase/chorismate mutase
VDVSDALVSELREEITALDRELVATVNRRLEIVRRLHEHKAEQGIPLRDHGREESMLQLLSSENPGPLSEDGLAGLYRYVLDLTRREIHGE